MSMVAVVVCCAAAAPAGRGYGGTAHRAARQRRHRPRSPEQCGHMGGDASSFHECGGVTYCCGVCNGTTRCVLPRGSKLEWCACGHSTCDVAVPRLPPPDPSRRPPADAVPLDHTARWQPAWTRELVPGDVDAEPPGCHLCVRYAVLDGQLHRNVADAEKLKTENPGVYDDRLLAYEDIVAHAVTGLGNCVSDAVAWVSYADECPCRGPVFCYASVGADCEALLMPSFRSWREESRWTVQEVAEVQACSAERFPADGKLRLAVWRGSTTGRQAALDISGNNEWIDLPRVKLALLGKAYPDLLDTAVSTVVQLGPEQTEAARLLLTRPTSAMTAPTWMNKEDFQEYAAVIDVDGNSWSQRFLGLLCQTSVVIKQRSEFREWFSSDLIPGVHYVEVRSDLADLVPKVKQVLQLTDTPDGRAELAKMVAAANAFCRKGLHRDVMATAMLAGWTALAKHTPPTFNVSALVTNGGRFESIGPVGRQCS